MMLGVLSEIFFYQFANRLGEYKDWNVPASETSVLEYGTYVSHMSYLWQNGTSERADVLVRPAMQYGKW